MEQQDVLDDCVWARKNLDQLREDVDKKTLDAPSEFDWDTIESLAIEARKAINEKRCDEANKLIAQARDLLRELPWGPKIIDPVSPDKLPRFR